LDLCDEKGFLCGRVLAELGAEVIKVEPPGGDPSRRLAPFYRDIPDPEKSLYFAAYNVGKKSVTLNLDHPQGRELFKKLAATADFVVESFPPGYLSSLGLGYEELSRINPRLIMTSITPFGQSGPYRDLKASDLTLMGMGGIMSMTGEPERPPLRLALDQSYYLAGAHAAIGCLMALQHRHRTGRGQAVDVSIYECLVRLNYRDPVLWEHARTLNPRRGSRLARGKVANRIIWKCRDGYVTWALLGGIHGAMENRALVQWMESEGMDIGKLRDIEWEKVDMSRLSQEELESWEEIVARFFLKHTREELERGGRQRRMTIVGIREVPEVLEHEQLISRGFWRRVEHPELGETITYPGHFFLSSEVPPPTLGRPPRIGEHNEEIYGGLGLSPEEIHRLKEEGVI